MEHRPLTDREIIEACCLNMVETYFALAKSAEGASCFEDDGIIGCRSILQHPAANFTMVARPNIHSVSRLTQRGSHTAYVLPTDQSQSVVEMLTRVGFKIGATLNLMFMRNPGGGINLDLSTVNGISARYDHTMFLAKQFFAPSNVSFCEGIASLTSATKQCELLSLEGRYGPAAGAMICQVGEVLGLYNISVAPENRHKGLGSDLVRSLVGVSASRKCTTTLQCHDSLVPWYERLGFRKYAEIVMLRN